jgi:hypothetical protein
MRTKTVKLKNRRVIVGRRESDKSIFIQFKRIDNKISELFQDGKYSETEIDGKLVKTSICISGAAAVSLFFLLKSELNISDLIEFEKETGQKVFDSEVKERKCQHYYSPSKSGICENCGKDLISHNFS